MYTCVVIDDDPISSGVITHYCEKHPELTLVQAFADPKEALSFLAKEPVDILFLDVEMPEMTGFELLDKLQYTPYVFMFTSKPQYAHEAYEYNVIDFLKKPVVYTRFCEAIDKLSRYDVQRPTAANSDEIFIRVDGNLIKVSFEAILFIEVVDDYIKVITPKATFLVLSTLKHIENKLSNTFLKVHRSYIINLKHIDRLSEGKVFIAGNAIPVSKAHRLALMSRLNIL
ncbi:MAG: LytTR family DNA-binding domain-containing protein [Chitinophagaceae bacterium]|uniref:LytR/AlgR family response regulator transcription factor n=1 Tax=unclassified Paraflavitalea TaxID=2798305 RepID=UPI003D332132|nr:LytTR family DNA-binding domain-containing protein [Chitinophagaceae bacterium]